MLPELKPLPCNESFRLTLPLHEVERETARYSLAMGFMVRDVEPYLERNMKAIFHLGRAFGSFRLFFVENDSRDRTRELLRSYMAAHPRVLSGEFMGNISRAYSVALCPISRRNCEQRIRLLARLRQRVFDLAWAKPGWDALVMLDFDFAGFARSEFLQMFVLGMRLNASAVVGVSMTLNKYKHCWQYDRTLLGHNFRDLTRTMHSHQGHGCMGGIMNGHSGFPTLYARALRAATPMPRYENQTPIAIGTSGFNDLAPFNLALSKWGRANGMPMLVDPRFRPLYPYGEGELYLRNATLARELWTKPE